MRQAIVTMLMLLLCGSVYSQTPRPPGWNPVPPGGGSLPVPRSDGVMLSQSSDALPVPVFGDELKPKADLGYEVSLPADATLVVDGKESRQVGGFRRFSSDSDEGEHEFTASIRRGGSIFRSTRRVALSPGGRVQVSFPELEACANGSCSTYR